jgi:phage terminase large subunit-like protein
MAMLPEEFEALPLREQFRLIAPFAESDTEAAAWVEETERLLVENPLLAFEPHPAGKDGRRAQLEFIEAESKVVAAFAGNQFGKSTVLTVCALREVLPEGLLPDLLRRTKRYQGRVDGWILVPTEDKIFDSFQPAFEDWCPPGAFRGGSWGKAFRGDRMVLTFEGGSTIAFKTYKQDPSTLGGARLHFVGYDEPPPRKHREESRMRLSRYGGHEMLAMTPLEANSGYARREIWKKRESPEITVVRGSIHDNPTLDRETVALTLGSYTDIWRQAREFGDFVNVGGMMYPDWERCVVKDPWDWDFIRSLDIVVGIDPGIRNAGFAWVGFDRDLTAYVFNEGLLQDKESPDYAAFLKAENARLGLRDVSYVCDPAMRARGQVNAETVMGSLAQHGIYANVGQNSHEAGFDQMRSRMRNGRFFVSPTCRGLRDEADEYAAKEPGEDKDDSHLEPVSNQFHRLDALRYAVMERFWDPIMEDQAPQRVLGWRPGEDVPDLSNYRGAREVGPMGLMS